MRMPLAMAISLVLIHCGSDETRDLTDTGPLKGDAGLSEIPDSGDQVDGGATGCGVETCDSNSVCVFPCCGGAPPPCEPRTDAGVCPQGTEPSSFCSDQGLECARNCVPPPPYCAPIPSGCDPGALDCECFGGSVCNASCGFVEGREVACICA